MYSCYHYMFIIKKVSFVFRFTMLLRVIQTEEDCRRVTIENMPDTVEGLHLILKNKLGLEGVLRVQFQDMFNNELCNLSMSELPTDRVTLKVYSQPLELNSDTSTLDTASLTTSDEGSPSDDDQHLLFTEEGNCGGRLFSECQVRYLFQMS